MNQNKVKILLVEDNPGDIELTLMAFDESEIGCEISVVQDGEKALEYLYKKNEFLDVDTPHIILLDINLPILNGFEVLEIIKNDQCLKAIPVLVLTTSDTSSDILEAYANHANAYLNKPVDFVKFVEVVDYINNFWFELVRLPKD